MLVTSISFILIITTIPFIINVYGYNNYLFSCHLLMLSRSNLNKYFYLILFDYVPNSIIGLFNLVLLVIIIIKL